MGRFYLLGLWEAQGQWGGHRCVSNWVWVQILPLPPLGVGYCAFTVLIASFLSRILRGDREAQPGVP